MYFCLQRPWPWQLRVPVPPIRVLANNRAVQAVEHAGLGVVQAAYYQAGSEKTGDGLVVTANAPCMIMVARTGDQLRLSVADPTQKRETVTLRFSRRLDGPHAAWDPTAGMTAVAVPLPAGERAGSSQTLAFRARD